VIRRALVVAVLGRAGFDASLAHAASPESRAEARQHLNQARDAKKRGQLADACGHLKEVERLDPKLPTLIELAECTEELGKLVEARVLWVSARDRAKHDEKPQSRARAESRLAAVEARIAHLTLELGGSAASGAQALLDDVPLAAASLGTALAIDPGEHLVVVKLAGHDDAKYPLKLAEGDRRSVPIAPGPTSGSVAAASPVTVPVAASTPPVVAPSPPSPATSAASADATAPRAGGFWTTPRKVGAILGVVGLAGVGGGSALCVSSDRGNVDSRLALGGASIAFGGVLVLSGLVLLVGGSSEAAPQQARRLTPSLAVGRGATWLGASGAF